jgi:broad specificity polyphosphatase/5'/3'-nucleotidase SurE
VLSGINHGQNMGEDALYWGPSPPPWRIVPRRAVIAVSFAGGDLRADVSQLKEQVKVHAAAPPSLRRSNFPADTLFNVNLPPVAAEAVKGVKLTRPGRRVGPVCRSDAGSWAGNLLDRRRCYQLERRADSVFARSKMAASVTPPTDLTLRSTRGAAGWWREL